MQVEYGCENDGLDLEGDNTVPTNPPENKDNNDDDPALCYDDLGPTVFDTLTDPVYAADDAPCLSEVLAIMFAWMGRHKSTDASAEDVWGMLGMLIPKEHNLPSFSYAKNILEKHLARTMEVIEICPCDRTAYWDFKSAPLQGYKNSHRTRCPLPKCNLSRHVDVKTPHGMRSLPRKVMYYISRSNSGFRTCLETKTLSHIFTTIAGNSHLAQW
jgi:hypothetical protein